MLRLLSRSDRSQDRGRLFQDAMFQDEGGDEAGTPNADSSVQGAIAFKDSLIAVR